MVDNLAKGSRVELTAEEIRQREVCASVLSYSALIHVVAPALCWVFCSGVCNDWV